MKNQSIGVTDIKLTQNKEVRILEDGHEYEHYETIIDYKFNGTDCQLICNGAMIEAHAKFVLADTDHATNQVG